MSKHRSGKHRGKGPEGEPKEQNIIVGATGIPSAEAFGSQAGETAEGEDEALAEAIAQDGILGEQLAPGVHASGPADSLPVGAIHQPSGINRSYQKCAAEPPFAQEHWRLIRKGD